MATLTNVKIQIAVRDGVDAESTVQFKLYHNGESDVTAYYPDKSIGNNTNYEKNLTIHNAIDKNAINETTFYMEINANGRDSFNGHLIIVFTFSDNTQKSYDFGNFSIGTYHESNSTRQKITV